jgi:ERCC4-type nuclease
MSQNTLDSVLSKSEELASDKVKVFVDNRELRSRVSEHLRALNVDVVEKQLSVADYVVSDRVAIERKSVNELANSIYTNRLFDECKRLREAYEIPILILEGYMPVIFKMRKTDEGSIWGAIASIAVQLRIVIVPTQDVKHTAKFIERLAFSEQVKVKRPVIVRPREKSLTLAEQQQYLVSGLPNIGTMLADILLSKAQTPYNVFKQIAETEIVASKTGKTRRLKGPIAEVRGIGPAIVESAKRILTSPYSRDDHHEEDKDKPLISEQNIEEDKR